PTSIVRITCHERFCKIVQTGPVDHNSRPTYRVDEWSSRGVTQHVHVASLCRVHERLTHITVNHELTVLENLSSLILSSTMDRYRSEEHTSELQSRFDLVCRLLLEKKN